MKIGVIGIGLIGGSLAKSLKQTKLVKEVIGFDLNENHLQTALELSLVDRIVDQQELIRQADVILLTIPVNAAKNTLPQLLSAMNSNQVIIDFGSTKEGICQAVGEHPNRSLFVAAHPIAGTENTGPSAAINGLFNEKVSIICESEKSSAFALSCAQNIFNVLNMRVLFMTPEEHDRHIAYVSHLSHISSFVLGKTVLEIEKDEENIFNMAGSGFASTVRLAKSNPNMWAPIFNQNAEHLSVALGAYIKNLQEFQKYLENKDSNSMFDLMEKTNSIRRVLAGIEK